MEEFVEFENMNTGRTRKFPLPLFDSLNQLCLRGFPAAARTPEAEDQVGKMVAEFLDSDMAEPLRMAAESLFPTLEDIRLNSYSPEIIQIKIKSWANSMFARYGHPVWLVGPALDGAGRDVDIRIILPDADFDARFPNGEGLELEVGKQGRHAALYCRMNIDFQIQKFSETMRYDGKRLLRMDTCTYPEAFIPPQSGIGAE